MITGAKGGPIVFFFIVVEDSSSDGQVVFHGGAGELGGVHQAKPSLPEPIG